MDVGRDPSPEPAPGPRTVVPLRSEAAGAAGGEPRAASARTRGPLTPDEIESVAGRARLIADNIASVILGKDEVIQACVVALISGGHLMLEDFPGVGKTLLAKSLARSVNCRFARVQFTPDLLPSDITGVNVFNQKTGEFDFRPGPIFANIVLADEINRASPKTQSSLLECMGERQATIDNVTRPIDPPFMVIATQNPIEYEGTYPLPEAQLDRFMMLLTLGYPDVDAELALLDRHASHDPLEDLQPVVTAAEVRSLADAATRVRVAPALRRYVVDLLSATRDHREIYLGASPRAGIALLRAAMTLALLRGRDFAAPQDVKDLAVRVLSHRIMLSPDARVHGLTPAAIIKRLLDQVPVPTR